MLCFSWWKSDRSCKKPVTMRARCEASLNRSGRVLQLAVHLRSELKLGKTRLTSGHVHSLINKLEGSIADPLIS